MRYSSRFKAEAVRSVLESERPISWIARKLEVSPSTLRRWMDELEPTLRAEDEAVESNDDLAAGGADSSEDTGDSDEEGLSLWFKGMAVHLAESSPRPVEEVARQLGVSASSLVRWRLEVAEEASSEGGRAPAKAEKAPSEVEKASTPTETASTQAQEVPTQAEEASAQAQEASTQAQEVPTRRAEEVSTHAQGVPTRRAEEAPTRAKEVPT
ncbi:MAG: transposase, partial [Gemmatimonadetes bacterium]|nr:transposase [Gemmatimonadota bacterium]